MATSIASQQAAPPSAPSDPANDKSTPSSASNTTSVDISASQPQSIPLTVTFLGGLAPVFVPPPADTLSVDLPPPSSSTPTQPTIGHLVQYLTKTYLGGASGPASKREMFVLAPEDASPRPGILVLVDDTDWELDGGPEWVLSGGERVVFVSTLHGG